MNSHPGIVMKAITRRKTVVISLMINKPLMLNTSSQKATIKVFCAACYSANNDYILVNVYNYKFITLR